MTDRPAILITGATDGLGRALAQALAADGATLILHGRDQHKLDRTAAEIRDGQPAGRLHTVLADLSELAQVRRLAADVRQAADRLDVLVSNAGIGSGPPDGRTRRCSPQAPSQAAVLLHARPPGACRPRQPHRSRRCPLQIAGFVGR